MAVLLSICIPTYNRAQFLAQAIESIIADATDEIEIIISDNASTDNTADLVLAYKQEFSRITYFCWKENMGADLNFLKSVELATGNYCWILGSDDAIAPGSIRFILDEIKRGYDIYLFNRLECNLKLEPVGTRYWLGPHHEDQEFNLAKKEDLCAYLSSATSLGAIFSYISSSVFRRNKWNNTICKDEFIGSAYSHVYMLLSFIQQECKLKYIRTPLVMCRMGNDSFLENGVIKRFLIDIDGYLLLANTLLLEEATYQSFLGVMKREHPWLNILHMRQKAKPGEWIDIEPKLIKYGYNKTMLKAMRSRLITKILLKYYRLIRKRNKY